MYFPSDFDEIIFKKDEIPKIFENLINCIALSKPIIKANYTKTIKSKFLNDIITIGQNTSLDFLPDKITIDETIEKINLNLCELQLKNHKNFQHLQTSLENKNYPWETPASGILRYKKNSNFSLLSDFELTSKERENYISYLLKKHEEKKLTYPGRKVILSFKDEMELRTENLDLNSDLEDDHIQCLVCNDGDYEETNMIVFCSICQLTVHQSCYGIIDVPADDWICNVCKITHNTELECILCPVKGGAMKQCNVKKSSAFYSYVVNLRSKNNKFPSATTNETTAASIASSNAKIIDDSSSTSSNSALVGCCIVSNSNYPTLRLNSMSINSVGVENSSIMENEAINSNMTCASAIYLPEEIKNTQYKNTVVVGVDCRSDFISSNSPFKISKINDKNSANAWIHMSCALWNETVHIDNFLQKEEIGNIESIDKSRFKEYCYICETDICGPTIKCKESFCKNAYHVECARMNGYCLEVLNVKGTLQYNLYCHSHRPNKILKQIETRKSLLSEQIINFSSMLNKIYNNYEKEYEDSILKYKLKASVEEKKKYRKAISFKKKKLTIKNTKKSVNLSRDKLTPKERGQFIKQLKMACKLFSCYNIITLKKTKLLCNSTKRSPITSNPFNSSNNFAYSLDINSYKNKMRYYDVLYNNQFPWDMVKLRNYETDQLKWLFNSMIPDEVTYNRKILKRKSTHKIREDVKLVNIILGEDGKEKIVDYEADTNLYCYCLKRYSKNDVMIGCKNENNCVGAFDGWFHKKCLKKELKGMSSKEIEDESFIFTCKKCLDKETNINNRENVLTVTDENNFLN